MVLILLPVFGLTWIFGVLSFNEETKIFRYIFATLNSFQVSLIVVVMVTILIVVSSVMHVMTVK